MENIQIFIYSTIQGITEFLPVSSSAHLYFIQDIYKWEDNALLLALGAHLGTFLAVLVFNRKLFFNFKKNQLLPLSLTESERLSEPRRVHFEPTRRHAHDRAHGPGVPSPRRREGEFQGNSPVQRIR